MSETQNQPLIPIVSFTGEICHVNPNYLGQLEPVTNFDRLSTLGRGLMGFFLNGGPQLSARPELCRGAYDIWLRSLASEVGTGKLRAVKALKEPRDRDIDICVLRETKLLSSLRHPNIIGLRGVLAGSSIHKAYLVMEVCQQDLDRYIRNAKAHLPASQIRDLFAQLLRGLDFLHRAFIIHRDLKPANILLTEGGGLKIADFGLARPQAPAGEGSLTPGVVTLWYRSPELLLSCPEYGSPVDMWSAGCILAELCLLRPALQAETELGQLHLICDLLGSPSPAELHHLHLCGILPPALSMIPKDRPSQMASKLQGAMSPAGFSLLKDLLTWDPTARWTAHEALQTSFLLGSRT
ncbi:Cyclin-dependent kinase 10 [Massospora cicadina]|nr:Cyclin-dependent kinase 10 [Massospora cicadina]